MNKLFFLLLGVFYVKTIESLQCEIGFDVESDLISKKRWENVECAREDDVCQKFQGEIVIYNAYRINVVVGLCGRENSCQKDCRKEKNSTLLRGFSLASGLPIQQIRYTVSSCSMACCNNDLCNQKSVKEIFLAQQVVTTLAPKIEKFTTAKSTTEKTTTTSSTTATTTTTSTTTTTPITTTTTTPITTTTTTPITTTTTTPITTTTTTTTASTTTPTTTTTRPSTTTTSLEISLDSDDADDTFECMEGFEIANDLVTTSSWNTTLCNRSLQQKCIRGEGKVVVSNFLEISVVTAFCSNQSLCQESCNGLFVAALADLEASSVEYDIRSCQQTCCETNRCNNHTIAEIQRQATDLTTDVETTTTTTMSPPISVQTVNQDFFECTSGYEIISNFWNVTEMRPVMCRRSLQQMCSRAEGNILISGIVEVKMVTASCEVASSCEKSCFGKFGPALRDIDSTLSDLTVESCLSACCNTPNCNNKTIAEIEREKLPPSTTHLITPTTTLTTEATTKSTTTTTTTEPMSTTATTTTTNTPLLRNSLQCTNGFEIRSDFLNNASWGRISCESPTSSCIRSEIVASVFNNAFDVTLEVATCVDRSLCEQSCAELARTVFFSSETSSNSDIADIDFESINLRMCDYICCEDGNCNNNTVSDIRRKLDPSIEILPVLPPVEIVAEDDILECYSGYIVESDIFTYNNWRLMRCSDASQKCVRAEGAATLYNVVTASVVVGFCANTSQCNNQVCNNLLQHIAMGSDDIENIELTTDEFQINFCDSACCTSSRCNNQTVMQILDQYPVSTSTTIPDGDRSSIVATIPPETTPTHIPTTECSKPNSCSSSSCNTDKDEATLFLLSLIPRLRSLPPQVASEVKMRFLETMHQAQFGDFVIR